MSSSCAASPPRYEAMVSARAALGDAQWTATVATLRTACRVRRWSARCSRLESAMFAGAVASVALVMVESELLWTDARAWWPLKTLLTAVSALLAAALVWRYVLVCRVQVATGRLPVGTRFFSPSSRLLWMFLLEFCVCAFHVPVWVSDRTWHHVPRSDATSTVLLTRIDQLDVLVLGRVYLLGRFLRNSVGVQALARKAHVLPSFHRVDVASVWFTVKYLFQKRPLLFSLAALLVDWALTSTALNFLERGGVNAQLLSAHDAVWLTIVTMTSVGYGEIAPETLGGKLAIALGAILGGTVIITCLLRVVLIDALRFTPQEKLVVDVVRFHQHVRQRKQLAAYLLQRAWKLYRAKCRGKRHGRAHKLQLYAAAEAMRLLRFTQPAAEGAGHRGDGFEGVHRTCAALLETLQQDLTVQRASGLGRLEATALLLRSVTSPRSD